MPQTQSLKVVIQFGEENNIKIKRDIPLNKKIIDVLREIEKENPQVFLKKYMELKNEIKGHIVEYPLLFLKNVELGKSFFSVENLVPEYNFT